MRDKYLGDSYDIVKRFWAENLRAIAHLYAHPKFIPAEIRLQYTAATSISVFESGMASAFGILLDPHTGIRLPSKSSNGATASHATLPFIAQVFEELQPKYVICFDQSYHRVHELDRTGQMQTKMAYLKDQGLFSFYYVSHAPFLFIAKEPGTLTAIRNRLVSLGIPKGRLQP